MLVSNQGPVRLVGVLSNIRFAFLLLAALVSGGALAASAGESYMRNCAVCHLPGIADAPKVGAPTMKASDPRVRETTTWDRDPFDGSAWKYR